MSAFRNALVCITFAVSLLLTACMEHDDLVAQLQHPPTESQQQTTSSSTVNSNPQPLIRHRTHTTAEQSAKPPLLRWQAPMDRVNGEKLYPGEIDGYRLYYQASDESRVRIIEISDPANTSRRLDDFGPGDYHFSISTLDSEGRESARTGEVLVSVK
ncbi:MAG: fibronectin type III domain-containing protein [Halomonadaceae bacterium]|nr:MAG: fibronectin type III domain-containing protein [Halomonadaceae bacterium]